MSKKRVVLALGGNALGNNLPEQYLAVQETARAIADLIEDGNEVIISHGNGPQVGMINNAMAAFAKTEPKHPHVTPLSVCVAMSQAYIGYDLQNALKEELLNRGIKKNVATVITQVRVDPEDPAFSSPSKPIGAFMSREEAIKAEKSGIQVMEDAGRGYRRVVASPKPKEIVEIDTVSDLLNAGEVVIASGGGGIPVIREGNHLKGVGAVIDKDFASCLLAKQVNADVLIILTAVEKVALNFGKPDEKWLDEISVNEAKGYIKEGHFAPGSMLPKVQAAVEFAESGNGHTSLITLLQKARDGVNGKTGTRISL
ncbi:MAG: carbamate kinase [Lachnospiraceae bacterium]|nr:carbamate kinase [Lachnospiraceae bacterium]